jgi:hypothetical protein
VTDQLPEHVPFSLYAAVRTRLAEIDPALVPHPAQIGGFEGLAAVGAALLSAVGAHCIVKSIHMGGRVEHYCDTCPGKPAYPCTEHREIAEALGLAMAEKPNAATDAIR